MLCSSHSKDIVDNERAAIVPCQVFWADASGSGQWNQFGFYQPTNQPTNLPIHPSKWAGMPIHHPLPTLSKHTLEHGDAPFLGALLLVGDSVFGLEMEPRCAGACVLCCVLAPAPCGPPVLAQPPVGVLPPTTMMWLLPPTMMWLPPLICFNH